MNPETAFPGFFIIAKKLHVLRGLWLKPAITMHAQA
jgi:hypothetical protein